MAAADETSSKVVLLPFHMKNQFMRDQDKPLFESPEITYLRQLDDGIKSILNEPTANPEIKFKRYQDLFNKYSAVMKNVTKPFEIEIKSQPPVPQHQGPAPNEQQNQAANQQDQPQHQQYREENPQVELPHSSTSPPPNRPKSSFYIENAIRRLKSAEQHKANEVVDELVRDPRISWDTDGKIFYKNKAIEGSNIGDTIEDLMRSRKNTHPGFLEVAHVLGERKFPTGRIVNTTEYKRIAYGRKKKAEENRLKRYENEKEEEEQFFSVGEHSDDEDDNDDDDDDEVELGLDRTLTQRGSGMIRGYRQQSYKKTEN